MAKGTGNESAGHGAFRALQRGFNHWTSGRLKHLEVNCKHPLFCHVWCSMIPSMKDGIYHIYVLLAVEGEVCNIKKATCECAAGYDCNYKYMLLFWLFFLQKVCYLYPCVGTTTCIGVSGTS